MPKMIIKQKMFVEVTLVTLLLFERWKLFSWNLVEHKFKKNIMTVKLTNDTLFQLS